MTATFSRKGKTFTGTVLSRGSTMWTSPNPLKSSA